MLEGNSVIMMHQIVGGERMWIHEDTQNGFNILCNLASPKSTPLATLSSPQTYQCSVFQPEYTHQDYYFQLTDGGMRRRLYK